MNCVICGNKIITNDASYTVNVHAEGMKKEQIVSTIYEGDLCGLCASYFEYWIKKIKEKNDTKNNNRNKS